MTDEPRDATGERGGHLADAGSASAPSGARAYEKPTLTHGAELSPDDLARQDETLFPDMPAAKASAAAPASESGTVQVPGSGIAFPTPNGSASAAAQTPAFAHFEPAHAGDATAAAAQPGSPASVSSPADDADSAPVPDFLTRHHAPEHAAHADAAAQPRGQASPEDTADLIEAARAANDAADTKPNARAAVEDLAGKASKHTDADGTSAPEDDESSLGDTAELDVEAVEAKLSEAEAAGDPGSTQSFEPVTDDQLIDTDSTYDAGASTSLMWGARSDVGCVRSHNEDSYLVQSPLFAVCDGMGGHAAGEVASAIAVETISKTAPRAADPALLGAAVEAANAAVIEAAVNGLGKPGMGCTATVAYVENSTVAIAHVGDSRAYLLHDGSLIRVTHDHSYVEELVDAGEITADEARVHPNRSVITRALGSDPNMYADHFQIGVETGDRLILCSDGLSSMVPDGEIERIATQSATAQICTDNLVDAALAAGGTDNVTVIVVDLVDDGKLKEVARKRRRNAILAVAALLIVVVLGALFTFASIAGSVYLGVKDGFVAVYTGVPHSFLGLELHWLQDKSTVEIEDLPEDTQGRLRDGIPQDSVDQANETISKYRKQIYEEQTKAAESAGIVRDGAASGSATAPATTGDGANGAANASAASPSSSSQTGSAADAAASQNQVPSTATPQGGQSQ